MGGVLREPMWTHIVLAEGICYWSALHKIMASAWGRSFYEVLDKQVFERVSGEISDNMFSMRERRNGRIG
jgi:hypothetical protein